MELVLVDCGVKTASFCGFIMRYVAVLSCFRLKSINYRGKVLLTILI